MPTSAPPAPDVREILAIAASTLENAREQAVAVIQQHISGGEPDAPAAAATPNTAAPTSRSADHQTANADGPAPSIATPDEANAGQSPRTGGDQTNGGSPDKRPMRTSIDINATGAKPSPAEQRAFHLDSALRLEQATGQPPAVDHAGRGTELKPTLAIHASSETKADAALLSVATSSADGPGEGRFGGHLVRGLSAMLNQRGGVMTMRLDPPDLGDLRIQMTLARGVVSAHFEVATHQAEEMINRHLGALRTSLESQGLTVDRLHVHVPASAQSHSTPEESSGEQSARHGGSDADQQPSHGDSRSQDDQQQPRRGFASLFNEPFASGQDSLSMRHAAGAATA